jgi:hypothetical protein
VSSLRGHISQVHGSCIECWLPNWGQPVPAMFGSRDTRHLHKDIESDEPSGTLENLLAAQVRVCIYIFAAIADAIRVKLRRFMYSCSLNDQQGVLRENERDDESLHT